MKKYLILFISLFVASIIFIGCDGSDSPSDGPAVIEVSTPATLNQTVNADQTTGASTIRFNTNNPWMSISTEDWAQILPSSGNAGNQEIVLALTPNTTYEERTAIITIISGEATPVEIRITQAGRERLPVVFTINHDTEFALPNARMIPFTVEPAGATISLADSTGLIVYTFTHQTGPRTGQGRLTLTPRRNFTGGTFEVRASYGEKITATKTLTLSAVERRVVGKKGVAMSTDVDRGNIWDNLYALKPHWWWSWGLLTDAQLARKPEGIEWVPSFWGGGFVTEANIRRVNQLFERGEIFYLRGFNEPDLTAESNMSVERALDLWEVISYYIHPDIKLIGPAESHPRFGPTNWQMRFMQGVKERALRVDYMAVHIYASSPSAGAFTNYLTRTYQAYGRRMWLMETGVRHPNVHGIHSNNLHTPRQIATMLETLLPNLENMDILHRYSWFEPGIRMAGLWTGRLIGCRYNDDGYNPERPPQDCTRACSGLTIVGEFYRDFMPNTNIRRRH